MEKVANILLVDDNKTDVALTLNAFKEARLKNIIQVARNGEEALNYVFGRDKYADRINYPLPDIILLDLKMPGISGLDVLKILKNTEKYKRIPVIIFTSSNEESDRAMGYDHGANSYLVKPVLFTEFLEVVKSVCNYWLTMNIKPSLE